MDFIDYNDMNPTKAMAPKGPKPPGKVSVKKIAKNSSNCPKTSFKLLEQIKSKMASFSATSSQSGGSVRKSKASGSVKGMGVSANRLRLRPMSALQLPLAQAGANRLEVRWLESPLVFGRKSKASGLVRRSGASAGRPRLRLRPVQQLPLAQTSANRLENRLEASLADFRFRRKKRYKG